MTLNFLMAELLNQRYSELGENWTRLEEEMADYVPEGMGLSRRQLLKISNSDPKVKFTIDNLRYLQEYLTAVRKTRVHENPFFRPSASLLDALRGERNVTVLYPSRKLQHYDTEGASRWDLRALQVLNNAPEIRDLNFAFQDVFHLGPKYRDAETLREIQSKEPWYQVLDGDGALISIGAPFSTYATEEILARMFRVTPYEPRGLDVDKPLPFYLYWPQSQRYSDSAFAVTAEELKTHFPEQFRRMGHKKRAILVGGELYPTPKFGEGMNLIVSQYWRGHMVTVILGVYAPSTLAIAEYVANRKVTESLGEYRYNKAVNGSPDDSQPILIHKIKTTIIRSKHDSSVPDTSVVDKRRCADIEFAGWERWIANGKGYRMEACDNCTRE